MPTYTEFYCDNDGGDSLNSGRSTGVAAYSTTSGNWTQSTRVFTPTDGSTPSSTVNVGDYASVFLNGASAPTGYVAQVTAVGGGANGTITLSSTRKAGSAPANSTGGMSIRVGGAWFGPSGASGFPFGFANPNLAASSTVVRVNIKGTFNITAQMNANTSVNGAIIYQGYSASPGDGGKFTIDGGTSGASYVLLRWDGLDTIYTMQITDAVFKNNGATGSARGIEFISGPDGGLTRVVVNNIRGTGILGSVASAAGPFLTECEAYSCNQANTGGKSGFEAQFGCVLTRCIAHDNNQHGFITDYSVFIHCIADTNTASGFNVNDYEGGMFIGCDSYNNANDGIRIATTSSTQYPLRIENCNFVKNGGYGVNQTGSGTICGLMTNSGFGSGSQANTSGQTNIGSQSAFTVSGSVTYASGVTPWVDPANGDFRINLQAAKGAGRGAFTETAASYAGTTAYPDIGAAQHQDNGMIRARVQTGF